MRTFLNAFARWLYRKTMPTVLAGEQWSGTSYVDAYKRTRQPSPNELMAELKGTAWTCASVNASVCANFPPRLYVVTRPGEAVARCATRPLGQAALKRLRQDDHFAAWTRAAQQIEQVAEHPLLTLLQQVNPIHNAFDLWELTELYLEVHGRAFCYGTP